MVNVFAVSVFFICFRESLESAIIVSVLLAFLKQTLSNHEDASIHKRLVRQVWSGVFLGLAICIIIGAGMIGAFYGLKRNVFSNAENIWEGVFALLATIIISLMGAALLRVSKLQDKWRAKLAASMSQKSTTSPSSSRFGHGFKAWSEKYAMFILPFVTVLREGLEAVVFIGGVGLGLPASSFPLAVLCGLAAGALVGYFIYKGQNLARLQILLIISTCFLYLVSAGLFSRAVGAFEKDAWNKAIGGDAAETGSGPGSYDIRQSVWHVNCCSPDLNGGGGWGIFNSIFGWTNSATYGTILSYNLYWVAVIVAFVLMRYQEMNGHLPFLRSRKTASHADGLSDEENRGERPISEGNRPEEVTVEGKHV